MYVLGLVLTLVGSFVLTSRELLGPFRFADFRKREIAFIDKTAGDNTMRRLYRLYLPKKIAATVGMALICAGFACQLLASWQAK